MVEGPPRCAGSVRRSRERGCRHVVGTRTGSRGAARNSPPLATITATLLSAADDASTIAGPDRCRHRVGGSHWDVHADSGMPRPSVQPVSAPFEQSGVGRATCPGHGRDVCSGSAERVGGVCRGLRRHAADPRRCPVDPQQLGVAHPACTARCPLRLRPSDRRDGSGRFRSRVADLGFAPGARSCRLSDPFVDLRP